MSDFRATYRLQLTPDFGFAEARAIVPYLRDLGISHLYLSPVLQARSGSTHGYDVVDPTRVSEELGGEDALRALCSQGGSAGLGVIVDVVPNHMAASDENPYWRDPPAAGAVLRLRAEERLVPPLLHDRRARRGARRGSRGLRDDPRKGLRAPRRGPRAGASHRPPGRARGSSRLSRASARPAGVGGEDPRAGRVAARLAGRGHDRVRVRQRRHGSVRRPGRRGAADRAVRRAHGRGALVRGGRGRGEARARAHRLPAGVPEAARAARPPGARGGGRVAPGLPDVRRAVVRPGRGCGPRGAGARAGRPAPDPAARRSWARRARHALPADDRARHGQGGRGHGFLPLVQADAR